MRGRAVVLAAAIAMAPLGARAADLVVWWEKGQYDEEDQAVRENARTPAGRPHGRLGPFPRWAVGAVERFLSEEVQRRGRSDAEVIRTEL
jgi:hypothetical protein